MNEWVENFNRRRGFTQFDFEGGWEKRVTEEDGQLRALLLPSRIMLDQLITIKREELGLESSETNKGWIPMEMTMEEICRRAEELNFEVVDTEGPLRNSKAFQIKMAEDDPMVFLKTYLTVGENPLSREDDHTAYIADREFGLFYLEFVPEENQRWIAVTEKDLITLKRFYRHRHLNE